MEVNVLPLLLLIAIPVLLLPYVLFVVVGNSLKQLMEVFAKRVGKQWTNVLPVLQQQFVLLVVEQNQSLLLMKVPV